MKTNRQLLTTIFVLSIAAAGVFWLIATSPAPVASTEATVEVHAIPINETEQAARDKEYRQTYVNLFNETFADRPIDWTKEVRGSGSDICTLRNEYYTMSMYMGNLKGEHLPRIEWNEVDVTRETAEAKLRAAAVHYATTLNKILDQPYADREKMRGCDNGEAGTWLATNMGSRTEDLIRALDYVGAKPEDIGTSAQKLRERLLTEFKFRIREARKDADRNPGAMDSDNIQEATVTWNFEPAELELTESEVETWKKFQP